MIIDYAGLRSRQPLQKANINRKDPLSRRLVFAAYAVGAQFYDAVSKQVTGNASQALVERMSTDGNKMFGREARGNVLSFPVYSTGLDKISGPFSLFTEATVLTNSSESAVVRSVEVSVSGDGLGINYDDANVITNGVLMWANNGRKINSLTDALNVNSEQFIHRTMITCDGTTGKVYAKNKLNTSAAETTLPNANTGRQTGICFGNGGSCRLVLAYDRVLSLDEYQTLYWNPFRVLETYQRRLWPVVSGGSTQALGGSFSSTDESTNAGTVAVGVVNLGGANASTDEKTSAGTVAPGVVSLGGVNSITDEKQYLAALLATIALGGSNATPDEITYAAAVAVGALALAGVNSQTDEKTNASTIAPSIALNGQNSGTDEKTNAGGLAAVLAVLGTFNPTDESFSMATIGRGTVSLGGQVSLTDETGNPGSISAGGQVIGGSFAGTDEKTNAGTAARGTVSIAGVFCATDEKTNQAALAMLAALVGSNILTDEKALQAALALGAVPLGGSNILTDEKTQAGQIQGLLALSGASIGTDECTYAGIMAQVTRLTGVNIVTDEIMRTSIVTVGSASLVGQFSGTDERVYMALIVSGLVVTRIIRRPGAYQTTVRRMGAYQNSVRRIGTYDG